MNKQSFIKSALAIEVNSLIKISGFFLLLIFLLSNSACKSARMADAPLEKITAENLIAEVSVKEFNAESIDARARMEVSFDGQSYSFRGQIRSIKDSAIWVRATLLGFEVGRVLITADTFQLLDRVNREYIKLPMSELGRRYGLDIEFNQLQQMLLGSPSFEDVVVSRLEVQNPKAIVFGFINTLQVIYYINEMRLVDKFTLTDPGGRLLESLNSNYQELGDAGFFAYNRSIRAIDGGDQFSLSCEFLELEINNNPDLPFSVPSRYDRFE
jgi:hypothetical protein